MRFIFTERTVSYPVFEIEADTLEAACHIYANRTTDGDQPDNEETGDNQLMEVTCNDKPVPTERWNPLVDEAIDNVNEEDSE
jgi:hypothetical protein